MTLYNKTQNFGAKVNAQADPTVFDTEFTAVSTGVNSKADLAGGAGGIFTGAITVQAGLAGSTNPARMSQIEALIPAGTRMLFHQASAPAGWAQDTTVQDGSMMRMVNVAAGATGLNGVGGSGYGGTHDANLGVPASATGGWAITKAQMPAHTHSYTASGSTIENGSDSSHETVGSPVSARTSGSTGSGATHTHPLTSWVPKYTNIIVCTKN